MGHYDYSTWASALKRPLLVAYKSVRSSVFLYIKNLIVNFTEYETKKSLIIPWILNSLVSRGGLCQVQGSQILKKNRFNHRPIL